MNNPYLDEPIIDFLQTKIDRIARETSLTPEQVKSVLAREYAIYWEEVRNALDM